MFEGEVEADKIVAMRLLPTLSEAYPVRNDDWNTSIHVTVRTTFVPLFEIPFVFLLEKLSLVREDCERMRYSAPINLSRTNRHRT